MKHKRLLSAVLLSITAVVFLSFIESILKPSYLVKSILKILCFAGSVFFYSFAYKEDIFSLIHLKKKMPDKKLIFFLLFVYAGIILLFFLLKERIDLSAIRRSLLEKEGLNKDNFLFIFSYIILCNSFLEEAFFRGFLIEVFKKEGLYKAGSMYSAILFALYHIGIVANWFQPLVFLLCIVGLSLAGLFLEWICERNDTLLASYAVHAFANLAINTIGTFMMFM